MQKILLLWSTLMLDKFGQGAIGQFKFWYIVFLTIDLVKKKQCLFESAFDNLLKTLFVKDTSQYIVIFTTFAKLPSCQGPCFASLLCASRLLEKLSFLPHLPNC